MPKKYQDWDRYGYSKEEWEKLPKSKRYRIRNPEKMKTYVKRWADSNPEHRREITRRYQLKYKYGIDEEYYQLLLKSQNFTCAICHTDTETGKWKRFCVDHCHLTGKVRGLLCNECNRGMGLLKDSEEILLKAAEYLINHKTRTKEENDSRKLQGI